MSAPELRAFVYIVLDELEDQQRAGVIDSVMARASKGDARWKPNRPSPRIVNDAKSFADAARRVGYADPSDVSEHLRLGSKAFLAGDHASARAVFEALLLPIAAADIDLGQHELVEEMLEGVDGLERIARETKRPQACLAWCEAHVDRGDWAVALPAYDASAALVSKSHWRGELLDGGALAAQQLGRPDVPKRLETAWRTAPTLTRLLRWLPANGHTPAVLRAKAKKALARCPKTAGRQLREGCLRVDSGLATEIQTTSRVQRGADARNGEPRVVTLPD